MAKTPYERNKNAIKKYIAEKTDDIRVRAPKGTKEEWKAYAESKGQAVDDAVQFIKEVLHFMYILFNIRIVIHHKNFSFFFVDR